MSEKDANLLKAVFSGNLKRYMDRDKMNTADLANALSLPFSTVSDWVHGRKYPRMDKVQIIADFFGIMKSDLTEESTDRHPAPQEDTLMISSDTISTSDRCSEPVYKILEEIMSERDLSIADVARICNLPDPTVRGIVKRKQATIALEVAFKLSDGLGVSLERLNGMPEKEPPVETKNSPSTAEAAPEKLSAGEKSHIKKYRLLDPYGKEAVDGVLDVESRRCEAARETAIQESREQMEAAKELPATQKKPIPIFEDGLEDSDDFLMKYVKRLNPAQQQMLLDQARRMRASQKEALTTFAPPAVDDTLPESEPPTQS